MKRTVVSLTLLLMSSLGARGAWGQAEDASFGRAHQLVVSADRLFGYVHSSETLSLGGVSETSSSNNVSIIGSPLAPLAASYATPRLAFDGFVTDGLSIGGSVSHFWTSTPRLVQSPVWYRFLSRSWRPATSISIPATRSWSGMPASGGWRFRPSECWASADARTPS
jgi:hypothetical protein